MLLDSISSVEALQPAQYSQNIQTIKQAATERITSSNKTRGTDNEASERPGKAENEAMESGATPSTGVVGATDAMTMLSQIATGVAKVDNSKAEQTNSQQAPVKPPVVTTSTTGNYQPVQQMMKDQLGAMMGGVDTRA
jgi:hypothetical protein